MADQTYDQWQFPDPPGNYPAPVAFVLRKLNEERSRADEKMAALTTIYTGAELPTDLSSYKVGDLFVLTDNGYMYYLKEVDGVKTLARISGTGGSEEPGGTPLSGQSIPIDNDNQLYAAMEKVLVALGATVP
jgi:hypothetical protein